MPATSSSKDNRHNSRNASDSRNESNNRTANTVRTLTTAGILAKEVKPATACRETNNNMNTINIRDNSSSSREANSEKGGQQQHFTTIVEHWLKLGWLQQRQKKHHGLQQ
jgi:hypothetical protein